MQAVNKTCNTTMPLFERSCICIDLSVPRMLRILLLTYYCALVRTNPLEQLDTLSAEDIQTLHLECASRIVCDIDPDDSLDQQICGSDGRTYSSDCELNRAVCFGNQVELIHRKPCSVKEKCRLERSFQQRVARNSSNSALIYVPACGSDGSYTPVQCHQATGYCWCVSLSGKPITGTSTFGRPPKCTDYERNGRRRASMGHSMGRRNRVCTTADRAAFNTNLVAIFRVDYGKEETRLNRNLYGSATLITNTRERVIMWKFRTLDRNNDGRLGRKELQPLSKMVRRLVYPRACARQFRRVCDVNGDRKVEPNEWMHCLGVDNNMLFEMFKSLDVSALPNNRSPRVPPPNPPAPDDNASSGTLDKATLWARSHHDIDRFLKEQTTQAPDTTTVAPRECSSQRRHALSLQISDQSRGAYVPDCQADHQELFSVIQCHNLTGYCWCADPVSGRPKPNSSVRFKRPACEDGAKRQALRVHRPNKRIRIRKCKAGKMLRFFQTLHADMNAQYQASSIGVSNSTSAYPLETAVKWKFTQLDTNRNGMLERREWRTYRRVLRMWRGLKRCGRNFLRHCDRNGDRRIGPNEWLDCVLNVPLPRNRAPGVNPFVHILKSE